MIKLLFFGSGYFPTPILDRIIKSDEIDVKGLVTSSKVEGNIENDVYTLAKKYNIGIYQPFNVNQQSDDILGKVNPDVILVCNYGQFLGTKILKYPKHKCLNIHFSLLPILRGACPIEMAIIKGLEETGITIQIMEEKMDTGDVLFQKPIKISNDETGGSLAKKLQKLSVDNIENVIKEWVNKEIIPMTQDHSKATYCFREDISKKAARIDWSEKSDLIERKVRAFNPRPGAWILLKIDKQKKRLKIYSVKVSNIKLDLNHGDVSVHNDKLYIRARDKVLSIEKVQLEGRKKMPVSEFLKGFRKDIIVCYS